MLIKLISAIVILTYKVQILVFKVWLKKIILISAGNLLWWSSFAELLESIILHTKVALNVVICNLGWISEVLFSSYIRIKNTWDNPQHQQISHNCNQYDDDEKAVPHNSKPDIHHIWIETFIFIRVVGIISSFILIEVRCVVFHSG